MPEYEIDWYATELAILRSVVKAFDDHEAALEKKKKQDDK